MAKVTLTDIESGYQLKEAYNANNDLLAAAIENTLSRDGTTPNQMEAQLDMNSNKIINVADGTTALDAVNLAQLTGKVFSNLDVGDATVVSSYVALSAIPTPVDGDVAFVDAEGITGLFVYDSTQSAVDNGGTIIDGWVRRYIGPVYSSWFELDTTGVANEATTIQYILTNYRDIVFTSGTHLLQGVLTIPSNTKVRCFATFNFDTASVNCLTASGVTGVDWKGGTMVSATPTNLQSFLVLTAASHHNYFFFDKIQDFRNKGIDVAGASYRNEVGATEITGSSGTAGAGVSIFGADPDDCMYNTVLPTYITASRIGVSLNGGKYNRIIRPLCVGTTLFGVGMDGVVTSSGDGPKYNYIENPVCINASASGFGGVYFGNGTSWNTIVDPVCINNLGAGIRSSGGVGYENYGNTIIGAVCKSNAEDGINLSSAPRSQLISCITEGNTGEGIQLFVSDESQIIGGRADDDTVHGLLIQSSNCSVFGFHATGSQYGIRTAAGGSSGINSKFYGCSASGNSVNNYLFQLAATVRDCEGYVSENSGSATLLSGTQSIAVNHGLSFTPTADQITVSPNSDTTTGGAWWFGTITSTQFTIRCASPAGVNIGFVWQARQI